MISIDRGSLRKTSDREFSRKASRDVRMDGIVYPENMHSILMERLRSKKGWSRAQHKQGITTLHWWSRSGTAALSTAKRLHWFTSQKEC